MPGCPTTNELQHLLERGRMADAEIELHIQNCPTCQLILEQLTHDPQLVTQTSRVLVNTCSYPVPTEFLQDLSNHPPVELTTATQAILRTSEAFPILPGFRVLRVLGHGGMGVVYEAIQESLNRHVAIKMRPQWAGSSLERKYFHREASTLARLQHPNIVQVFEIGEVEDQSFLVMEYAGGLTLADQLLGDPWLPRKAVLFLVTLASAVQVAHEHGIVHRDLKPGNILFTEDGTPKIADFGLAYCSDNQSSGVTLHGGPLGTPSYAAPELLSESWSVNEQSAILAPTVDVYSLGAILYELLTGRPPFRSARPVDTLLQALHQEPIPMTRLEPRIPRDLETIGLKCLHKNPSRRYGSAKDLVQDLQRFLDGQPIQARPITSFERAWKWFRRNPSVAITSLVICLCGVIVTLALTWLWREAEHRAYLETKAREESDLRADLEAVRLQETTRRNAELQLDQFLSFCEQGEIARGMQGLLELLKQLPPKCEDLEHVIRLNLSAWRYRYANLLYSLPHPQIVQKLIVHPDGRSLLTASGKEVRLWDLTTGKQRGETVTHPGFVLGLKISPDGRWGASWSEDGLVRLWDFDMARVIPQSLNHASRVTSLTFAPSSSFLITGSADGQVRGWTTSGQPGDLFLQLESSVQALAIRAEGEQILTAEKQGRLQIWETETQTPIGVGYRSETPFRQSSFDPSGRFAAAVTEDGDIRLLDVTNEFIPHRVFNPRVPFLNMTFADRVPMLAAGFGDGRPNRPGTSVVWDMISGRRLNTLDYYGPVSHTALSADGNRLLVGGGHRRGTLWLGIPDRPTPLRLGNVGFVQSLSLSANGRLAAFGRDDTQWAKEAQRFALVWALPPEQRTGGELRHPAATVMAISPDGTLAITADRDHRLRFWNKQTLQPIGSEVELPTNVESICIHPDNHVALIGCGKMIHRFDPRTGQRLEKPTPFPVGIRQVRFHPSGDSFAICFGNQHVEIRNTSTMQQIGEQLTFPDNTPDLRYHPDGNRLILVEGPGRVWIKNLPAGKPELFAKLNTSISSVTITGDGSRIVIGCHNRTVQILPLNVATPSPPPYVMSDMVVRVESSLDGSTVLAISADGMARFLETTTNRPIGPLLAQRVRTALFDPVDPTLWSAGLATTIIGWKVPSPISTNQANLPQWFKSLSTAE